MAWSADDIPDLTGRVAVVTGGNGGLGLETSRELARRGATVVIAARNMEKAAGARDEISSELPAALLELAPLDLASLESVRLFASRVVTEHPTIDVLVNNAGVMAIPRALTADGFEMQLGVNHLGHFALTALMLPSLLRSPGGRVVTVTSTGRYMPRAVDPEDPHLASGYGPWRSYGQSKLANLHFAVELHSRLDAAGTRVKSVAADPGFSATDLQAHSLRRSGGRSQRFFRAAVGIFGSSPSVGALPQLRAATDPTARGGELFALPWVVGGSPVRIRLGRRSTDRLARRVLWETSERETGMAFDVGRIAAGG